METGVSDHLQLGPIVFAHPGVLLNATADVEALRSLSLTFSQLFHMCYHPP